jgi:cytochrome bd-type quinol oxidase subunit 2
MVCYITCALAVAFIVASLYIMLTSNKSKDYESLLTEQIDMDVYNKIVKERIKIYIIASIIGIIFGIIYVIWKKNKIATVPLICTAVLIFFLTQIFIYMIYPKSDYILNYVTNNEQSKAWLAMYNQMMKKFLIGFVIGLVGYALLCWAILK